MGLEVPPKVNEDLKAKIVRAALLKKYQTEELFVLKTAQFQGTCPWPSHDRDFEAWCRDPMAGLTL